MEISILQTGIADEKHREFLEDRWICRLQTLKDLNTELHQYGKEMYGAFSKITAEN